LGTIERLAALDACQAARDWLATQPSLREAWDTCGERSWMTWLIGRAHSRGSLSRERLVQVTLRVVEPVLHLLPDDCTIVDDLGIVAAWTVGRATREDLRVACDRINAERRKLWNADAAAATAAYAYAAAADADAAAAAYAAAATAAAAAYAAYAAAAAAADADALCDVLRAAITIDEIGAALGLDPDERIAARDAA
jgi:hypothetical protein